MCTAGGGASQGFPWPAQVEWYGYNLVALFADPATMAAIKDAFFPTPYSVYILLGMYSVLCITYMTCGIHLSMKLGKMTLKSSPILFLILYFISAVTSVHMGPVQAVGDIGNLQRIIFGLIFSFLGDCYLVFDSLFIHGLVSFACAQLVYVGLFGGRTLLFTMPSQSGLVAAAAVGLVSLWVYCYVYPKLSRVLVVAAALYCLLISLMLWCALVTVMQDTKLSTLLGAIGACLFYTSDLLLAIDRWGSTIPHGPYLVIATYYAAQVFIFMSVINKF